jgi:magnesium chelatase family protein
MEEGSITVARARGSVRFPAQFILLAAMNPCPCGYRGSSVKACSCSGTELARYNKKLSGPIMDRIDLWVPVQHIEYESLHEAGNAQETISVQQKVSDLRDLQYARANKLNSMFSAHDVHTKSKLTDAAKKQLQLFAEKLKLSPRSYLRTIKVSRTIADLDNSETIEERHILEALQYRPKFE